MPKAQIRVANMRQPIPDDPTNLIINTCSNSKEAWSSDLSPFLLGPCNAQDENGKPYVSINFENLWQYSKAYLAVGEKFTGHLDNGNPTTKWWEWAKAGWDNPKAVRYPMGRGARPQYSYWRGKKLTYVAARKAIYAPIYAALVLQTKGFKHLVELAETHTGTIYLRDFDGYDEVAKGMDLTQVLNNPSRKMGHSFVVKMLLMNDIATSHFTR